MIEIIKYLESGNKILHKQQIKNIFLNASTIDFTNDEEKNKSFKKWTDYYLENHPEWIYIAVKGGQCVAYLMACPSSDDAEKLFSEFQSYDLFKDQFGKFPAHLHINTHESLRGQGIGAKLVKRLCSELKIEDKEGLHIITSPDADNVHFYDKLGFSFHLQRDFKDLKLLFMGKELATA